MIQKIVNVKDPILRKKAKPVKRIDKKIKSLIADLKETLIVQKDPEGVGLAAPQIGKSFQIFAMKPEKKITIVINPKIIWIKDVKDKIQKSKKGSSNKVKKRNNETEPEVMEGCLSLPHYYGPIKKPNRIKISYLNEKGEKVEKIFKDFEAQIIQHEIDHLKGILFVDRLLEQEKPLYKVSGEEWEKVDIL
ncbi:peptide deformylase [Candidatus Woesebacteria bacterium]|nr:peptide deformylase [Candidatus Woesebacteria bacterium]